MFCCCSYIPEGSLYVERIDLPEQDHVGFPSPTLEIGDEKQRSWFLNEAWQELTKKTFLSAAVTGVPIVIFFYFDQNISSLLCQTDEMHQSKD